MKKEQLIRDNISVPYAVIGDGEPLFIIGFGFYTYRLFSRHLKQSFKAILSDYRLLRAPEDTFDENLVSLPNILADIRALQDHLGYKKDQYLRPLKLRYSSYRLLPFIPRQR